MSNNHSHLKIFLSHDWAYQAHNHGKVSILQEKLGTKIQLAWIDHQQIHAGEDLKQKISQAIIECDVLVVIVTDNYQRKYNSRKNTDYCYFELETAVLQTKPILPIYLEDCMLHPPFQTLISPLLGIDMRDSSVMSDNGKMNELCERIVSSANYLKNPGASYPSSSFIYSDHLLNVLRIRLGDPVDVNWKLENEREKFAEGTRGWLFEEVEEWIRSSDNRLCWIRGEAGTGKTVFMSKLAERLGRQLVGMFFFVFNDARCSDPCEMIRSIIYQIAATNWSLRERILTEVSRISRICSLSPKESMGVLVEILKIFQQQQPTQTPLQYVILLDALDELTGADNKRQRFLSFLSDELIEKLPNCFRVIVTGRLEEDVLTALSTWDPFIIDETDMKHRADMEFYIRHALCEQTENEEELNSLARLLMDKSEGKFVYLHAMSERIARLNGSTPDNRYKLVNEFPQGLNEYYFKYFSQLRDRIGVEEMETLKKVISIIIAAKEPVSLDDIEYILDEEEALNTCVIDMRSLFPLNEDSGLFKVYHKSIVDYLIDRKKSGEFFINVTAAHRLLSKRLLEYYDAEEKPVGAHFHLITTQYMYSYLLDHLDEGPPADQRTAFKKLISLSWLQQTVQHKEIGAVIHDCYKRISNQSWLDKFPRYREEIREIYWFLKLIAHIKLPRGSDDLSTMLSTQITGRFENKAEYKYSKEMQRLILDAKEWLVKVNGYAFVQPCMLKTPRTSRQLLQFDRYTRKACLLSKDQFLIAKSPNYFRSVNVYTNEEGWDLSKALGCSADNIESIAVLSPIKVAVSQRGPKNTVTVCIIDLAARRKIAEIVTVSSRCELSAIPGEEKVVIWNQWCNRIFIWDGMNLEEKNISINPFKVKCCKFNGCNFAIYAEERAFKEINWRSVNLQTNEETQLLLDESHKLVVFPESEVIATYSKSTITIMIFDQVISTSPSFGDIQIECLCECGHNLALVCCGHSSSNVDCFILKTMNILTWESFQIIPISECFMFMECVGSIVFGSAISFRDAWLTILELPFYEDHSISFRQANASSGGITKSSVTRMLGSFKLSGELLQVLEASDDNLRISSYKIDRKALTCSFYKSKVIQKIEEMVPGLVRSRCQLDGDWRRLLYLKNDMEVEVIDLVDGSSIHLETNKTPYNRGYILTNNRVILKNAAPGVEVRYDLFEGTALQYSIALPRAAQEVKQISEDEILFYSSGGDIPIWNLQLKQMKRLEVMDWFVLYNYHHPLRIGEEGSHFLDSGDYEHHIVQHVDWEGNKLLSCSIHNQDLFNYCERNHLPLHFKKLEGTPVEQLWLHEPSECHWLNGFSSEGLMVLYHKDNGFPWYYLVRCGQEEDHETDLVENSLEELSLTSVGCMEQEEDLIVAGSSQPARKYSVYRFHSLYEGIRSATSSISDSSILDLTLANEFPRR